MSSITHNQNQSGRFISLAVGALLCASIMLSLLTFGPTKSNGLSISLKKGIGLVTIFGPITYGSQRFGVPIDGIELWINQLKGLGEDPNVMGVVLHINSPGGTAGSSSELYAAIQQFRTTYPDKPVVVSIGDVGASGAYWTAVAADHIFANAVSMVGSIGVLMAQFDLTRVPEKYGISQRLYKSAPLKDFMSSWRNPTDQEIQITQSLLDDIHTEFVQVIANSRDLDVETVRDIATGQVYSGHQAKALGLIDDIGGLQDALNYTADQVGLEGPVPVIRSKATSFNQFFELLGTMFSFDPSSLYSLQSALPILR